jgi:hypothetical protein
MSTPTKNIPTMTVRLDECAGLVGWTAEVRPGTTADPRPALIVADAAGVVQAAERIDGLDDADFTEVTEEVATDTVMVVDMILDPTILDGLLRRMTGRTSAVLPGATRSILRAADAAWQVRAAEAEDAPAPSGDTSPAPSPTPNRGREVPEGEVPEGFDF